MRYTRTLDTVKVFVCATYSDLIEERKGVMDAILRLQHQHDSMEFFGARTNRPIETCLEEVRASDVLVLIIGHLYGTIVPNADLSFTETEYNEGYRLAKPCLVYMKDPKVPILVEHAEQDPDKLAKLGAFKKRLQERYTVAPFRGPNDLALQVASDIPRAVVLKPSHQTFEAEQVISWDQIKEFLLGEERIVLQDAGQRMGLEFDRWGDLKRLLVEPRLASGLRPRLTEEQYRALEQQRAEGDYRGTDGLEAKREAAFAAENLHGERSGDLKWTDWSETGLHRQTVILGDPGFGKTALLWRAVCERNRTAINRIEAGRASESTLLIAVLLRADELAALAAQLSERSSAEVHEQALLSIVNQDRLRGANLRWLRESLESGRCLIAVDALDEVPATKTNNLDWLRHPNYTPPQSMIFTSRLAEYGGKPVVGILDDDELEILPYDESTAKQATVSWFWSDPRLAETFWAQLDTPGQAFVRQVLLSPLLLRLACQAFQPLKGGPKWKTQTDLYQSFMQTAWDRGNQRRGYTLDLEQSWALEQSISRLAYELWRRDPQRTFWNEEALRDAYNKQSDRNVLGEPGPVKELEQAGLLVKAKLRNRVRSRVYYFIHRTLHEWLAARYWARQLERARSKHWDNLNRWAWLPERERCITFVSGQLSPEAATTLLQVIRSSEDDIRHHRLVLAIRCLPELREQHSEDLDLVRGEIVRKATSLLSNRSLDVSILPCLALANPKYSHGAQAEYFLEWLARTDELDDEYRADLIACCGSAACIRSVVNALLPLFERRDSVPFMALPALKSLGTTVTEFGAVEALLRVLNTGEEASKNLAADVLGSLGPAGIAHGAVEGLLIAFSSNDNAVVKAAAYALGDLGAAAVKHGVVESLLLMCNRDVSLYYWVAFVLGRLGPTSVEHGAVEGLLTMLGSRDTFVAQGAADALSELGPSAVERAVEKLLFGLGTAESAVASAAAGL